MPLARYFLWVGGALLALLFMVSAEMPTVPAEQVTNTAAELPMIRIHTDRKWPERVVFDTSVPAVAGPAALIAKSGTGAPVPLNMSDNAAPDTTGRVREAFAQLQPPEAEPTTQAKQLQTADPKKPELKRPVKRKVARRHMAPPTMMIAQQPPFGFFGKNIW